MSGKPMTTKAIKPQRATRSAPKAQENTLIVSDPLSDTDAASTVAEPAQGSNVRETFRLMATLIYPSIPLAYLDRCGRILQRRHMETIFEERSVQLLCAFPPCANKLRDKNAKFRVSLKKKEIYDATVENQFCSEQCQKKARVFVSRLVTKPPQLVPSLVDVFGTDKPNPFAWEKQQAAQTVVGTGDGRGAPSAALTSKRRMPPATTVWAKTLDLGVIERVIPDPSVVVASLAASVPMISENAQPDAPTNEFPDAAQAVLIEGFVFPSHKKSLAKKVESKWQQTAATHHPRSNAQPPRGEEIIVSDSDESDFGSSDEEDSGDDTRGGGGSSSSSLDLSDFDPEDDFQEDEIISSDDLPLFVNMWRILSSWITHDTNLVVAHRPLAEKPEPPAPKNAQEKKDRDERDRATQMQFNERYNAFALMLGRPLPVVAKQLALPCDRYASPRIDSFVKSFSFRDAIDGRNSHLWTCIAAVLLLVAHDKQVETMTPEELSTAQAVTKLDTYELTQLLSLFYTLRDESAIVVDDDVAARTSGKTAEEEAEEARKRAAANAIKKCRKCRRPHTKCVCSERTAAAAAAAASTADAPQAKSQDYSTDEITQMFRDAVTVRDHYEDLMEAAGGSVYDAID